MSNELQTKLDAILLDKNTNLLPENLKAGVTCLGIEGTLEGGATTGVKLFETIEEMNNSEGNEIGDLAVIYRSEIQNATVDSKFNSAVFPTTVVLPTAITDYVDIMYRATDNSVMFDCWGQLDASMFYMSCYSETGEVRIQYESSDGINYTRTDGGEETVDFGTEIYYAYSEYWNDAIGYFIQTGGMYFDGLFEYAEKTQDNIYTLKNPKGDVRHFDLTTVIENAKKDLNTTVLPYTRIEESELSISKWNVYKPTKYVFYKVVSARSMNIVTDGTSYYLSPEIGTSTVATFEKYVYENDILTSSETITIDSSSATRLVGLKSNTYSNYNLESGTNIENGYIYYQYTENMHTVDVTLPTTSSVESVQTSLDYSVNVFPLYVSAPTQFNATADSVLSKTFYGKNGAETGTLQETTGLTSKQLVDRITIWSNIDNGVAMGSTDLNDTFNGRSDITKLPPIDTANVTSMQNTFYACRNLEELPISSMENVTNARAAFRYCEKLTSLPLFDTSKVTNMEYMIGDCPQFETIPTFDTSSVTFMSGMFYKCTGLHTIPLLNTSNVTSASYFCCGCTGLVNVPLLDFSKLTSVSYMFTNCTQLSDESLNNILAMFTNATGVTSNKTLKWAGLTEEQAAKCTTLSNYAAFTAAGWTTGY